MNSKHLPFGSSSRAGLSVICARSKFTNQLLTPLLSHYEIMDPPISIFKPGFPSGCRFNSYSVNRADSQHASLMASAPPLCWIKHRILVFELVQVPVAPPLLTPAMRKQSVLQQLYNSTLYGTAEVKGVLGRVWVASVSDLYNEMKSLLKRLFRNFWMVYRKHLWPKPFI